MSCAMMWKRKSTCAAQIDSAKWNCLNYCLFWDWQSCRLPWKITLIFQFNENTFDLFALSLDSASLFQHFCFGKASSVFVFHWRCLNIKEIKWTQVPSSSHRGFDALNTKFSHNFVVFSVDFRFWWLVKVFDIGSQNPRPDRKQRSFVIHVEALENQIHMLLINSKCRKHLKLLLNYFMARLRRLINPKLSIKFPFTIRFSFRSDARRRKWDEMRRDCEARMSKQENHL